MDQDCHLQTKLKQVIPLQIAVFSFDVDQNCHLQAKLKQVIQWVVSLDNLIPLSAGAVKKHSVAVLVYELHCLKLSAGAVKQYSVAALV